MDEISSAPQSVQAAAYQITLDRVVGEHVLPDNCIVIAAGNRMSDKSVTYRMPKALANRCLHIETKADYDSWREWAVKRGVHESVIAYLAFRPDRLQAFDSTTDDLAFATPRSWEMASVILDGLDGDVKAARPLLAGVLGSGAAAEFCSWADVYRDLPDIGDIFAGKNPPVPQRVDVLYALVCAMTARARELKDDLKAIERSITYASKLPADFAALLMKDYLYLAPDYRETLLRIPAYVRWLAEKGGKYGY